MINAKDEFLKITTGYTVLCASLNDDDIYSWHEEHQAKHFNLPMNHTQEDFDKFLKSIDFKYDNGFGGQRLFGTIWCANGVWMSRGEYDGSEWWNVNSYPPIPESLYNNINDDVQLQQDTYDGGIVQEP